LEFVFFKLCTFVHIIEQVAYEWDPRKERLNHKKHGVHFSDALAVLEDQFALTMQDPHSECEERWITLGLDTLGRAVVLVYTWRGDVVRVISARPAGARERWQYEE
jgi:uncharacterized DUF497 family protein